MGLILPGVNQGSNLFHSFERFDVEAGRGAYFDNPAGIANIFSRVTGRDRLDILGRLGVLGNANLFLINPNGILFGRDASLNIEGSFVASTADRLVFADGNEFSAVNPQAVPQLIVSVPLGLQYGSAPGSITVEGTTLEYIVDFNLFPDLGIGVGDTLALLGGDVRLDKATFLFLNTIELGAIKAGTVRLSFTGNQPNFIFPEVGGRANIVIVDGGNSLIGGNLRVNTGSLEIDNSSIIIDNVNINANDTVILNNNSAIISLSENSSADIGINASSLILNNSRLSADANERRNAEDIRINTRDSVLMRNASISSVVGSTATGNGGDIEIRTGSLDLYQSQLQLQTQGEGNAGRLVINARDNVSFRESAVLSTVTDTSKGNGGDIEINASNLFFINNLPTFRTQSSLNTSTSGIGDAGNVLINVRNSTIFERRKVRINTSSEKGRFCSGSITLGHFFHRRDHFRLRKRIGDLQRPPKLHICRYRAKKLVRARKTDLGQHFLSFFR
ncbi:filamentous hemagglutinin N-terminal domain-containing protein [Leptolyngbya sp. 7M]|nr:filamentous hemagglutinin N-terminal domain-containing protein [Leptolyngbya sp. 7M]QYO64445.1 filamentous hemagglutinin N-terminal domain-containing protein [Leptolyngbya sp. 7M]